jgi:hypothetical protein
MDNKQQEDVKARIQAYRTIVEEYERLDNEIDALITRNGGQSKNMSSTDLDLYRELARKRRDILNEMRLLERDLLDE